MFWIFATFLLGIPLFVTLVLKYIDGGENYWKKRGVFSIPNSQISSLWDRLLFRVPLHTSDKLYYDAFKASGAKYAGLLIFRHPILFITDLDLVKQILVKDFDHFVNRKVFEMGKSDQVFDLMLINQEDQQWKDLRTTMSPTFTTGKIRRMYGIFKESSAKMTRFLKSELEKSDEIEMRDVCGRYTMDVIASTAFGVDSQNFEYKNSVFALMGRRMQDNFKGFQLVKVILLLLAPRLFRALKLSFFDPNVTDFFAQILEKSIKNREETGERREDFLQLMLDARDGSLKEDGGNEPLEKFEQDAVLEKSTKTPITDEIILAQATLFFLAGFDVMETLLMFAAYELALQEDVQERLFQEISEAGDLTYDVVNKLEYLDMVISETLRKYPAAVRSERRCTKDYKIPGSDYTIRKGTHILVPIYGIHHDKEIYPDPEKFDPERFTSANKAKAHPYSYLPFGHGPRNCIAMRFALMEGKTAIAHIVQNFKIQPCTKTSIPMQFSTNGFLKPVNGMWLTLAARK